ncbi:vascular-related unknown protein 1-like [Hibiscus syriacus]|uniref:vascular-related unknown protein 1-like n=1 Tax=Hibiscus syriacus TaxID=106335 RepID=UPI001922A479|nr:vascular-related unknown protein 1-like [Hibiscus syriacus]
MENSSINSSMKKPFSSKGTTTRSNGSDEESGWTAYFEDYYYYDQQSSHCNSSSSCRGVSISGAAAVSVSTSGTSIKAPTKSRSRKTRTKEICGDDSLEDTASSPVNSSKVLDVKTNYINPRKRDEQTGRSCPVKKGSPEKYSEKRV